jgi:hypothetical protein
LVVTDHMRAPCAAARSGWNATSDRSKAHEGTEGDESQIDEAGDEPEDKRR